MARSQQLRKAPRTLIARSRSPRDPEMQGERENEHQHGKDCKRGECEAGYQFQGRHGEGRYREREEC